jgi:polyisoprenoid-binding protein YceI
MERVKNIFKNPLIFSAFLAQIAGAVPSSLVKYGLDQKKSHIKWQGKVMGVQMTGNLPFKSGQFLVKNSKVESGTLVADLSALSTDSGMDAQLKSPLLLDVEHFPNAELKIKEVTDVYPFANGGPNAHIKGSITFHGETHQVESDFVMKRTPESFHATGKVKTVYAKMVDGELQYDVWMKRE